MKKRKEPYEEPRVDVILLSKCDIVTSSTTDNAPDSDNLDDWSKC